MTEAETPSPLELKAQDLWRKLKARDPQELASLTGALFENEAFTLQLWGNQVAIHHPDFAAHEPTSGKPLNPLDEAILAYYFSISDGAGLSGEWIAFTELPDGQFYTQAFQGYTGSKLVREFGNDDAAFKAAAEHLGGLPVSFGNLAFQFRVLPMVNMLVVCWLGDEDFPPSYRILFDSNLHHHLTTDAAAILGSLLTGKLIKTHHTLVTGEAPG